MTQDHHRSRTGLALLTPLTLLAITSGCDETAGKGSLRVLLDAESLISDGLQPGEDTENIRDGWAVDFAQYVVGVGDVDLHLASDADTHAGDGTVFAVDLAAIPRDGLELWQLDDLDEGRWEFGYRTTGSAIQRHDSVDDEDFDAIEAESLTYLIRGTLRQDGGRSCPPAGLAQPPAGVMPAGAAAGGDPCYDNPSIDFEVRADDTTRFGPCEIDGVPGVAITAGQDRSVAITIHGDHLFFNGFPEGAEGGVARYAQWLADCDLNLDGRVTPDELSRIAPSDLAELDDRFQLGGSPLTPLSDMQVYLRAQLKTQGHFQGEGECAADGAEHDH